jgi:glutamate/tyrosine decarboxylase-like PLP-dependent enzyme
MQALIAKLQKLAILSEALDPNTAQREAYQKQIHEYTNTFITEIDEHPAFVAAHKGTDAFAISNQTRDFDELLKQYHKEVTQKGINPAAGGHIGYIPGGGIYTSAIADYLAAVTNEYAGMFYGSPGAVSMENSLIDWMKNVFNFPKTAIGNLTSGGSIANLIALTAARDHHNITNGSVTESVIYMSPQVHHCIHKALRIIGLGAVQIRLLTLDNFSKIDTQSLETQIQEDLEKGLQPFLVIASAGTTDTGAIDPLEAIGNITKKHKLWYHIDGAYGGFFILVNAKKAAFKGIEMADSLVIDPHKSLFLPYGLGAVLVKDKDAVFTSHHYTANYMQDATEGFSTINPADVSPELTKHFRGLRLWLPLQLHGVAPFAACLEEKLLLTTYFRTLLLAAGFELGPTPDLSVSYFWYPSLAIEDNIFNKKLLEFMHQDGTIFLSSTQINQQFVIRIAILAFRTKKETIDKGMIMINKCLEQTLNYFKITT